MNQYTAKKLIAFSVLLFIVFGVASCAPLIQRLEPPTVSLVSVTPGEQRGFEQFFLVGLRVSNHNSRALGLVGMSYSLNLEGVDVLKGSANNLPTIEAYASEVVNVDVAISILEGLKLLSRFANKSDSKVPYQLTVNLDTGVPLLGVVPVVEKGEFDLNSLISKKEIVAAIHCRTGQHDSLCVVHCGDSELAHLTYDSLELAR